MRSVLCEIANKVVSGPIRGREEVVDEYIAKVKKQLGGNEGYAKWEKSALLKFFVTLPYGFFGVVPDDQIRSLDEAFYAYEPADYMFRLSNSNPGRVLCHYKKAGKHPFILSVENNNISNEMLIMLKNGSDIPYRMECYLSGGTPPVFPCVKELLDKQFASTKKPQQPPTF
jgi:glyoxylate utilization-related uncharacterized protein